MMLITTLVISVCKDGGVSVNVNLWFLVMYVRCEVLCRFVLPACPALVIKKYRQCTPSYIMCAT